MLVVGVPVQVLDVLDVLLSAHAFLAIAVRTLDSSACTMGLAGR
jgi:hypothetical protein